MKSVQKEALVKGVFAPEQAKEVITTLFQSKIQVHSLASFSSFVRTGSESKIDDRRKKELAESMERLLKAIIENNDSFIHVKIDCDVKIEFITEKSIVRSDVSR